MRRLAVEIRDRVLAPHYARHAATPATR